MKVVLYFVIKLLLVELKVFVLVVPRYSLFLVLLLFVRFVLQLVLAVVLDP